MILFLMTLLSYASSEANDTKPLCPGIEMTNSVEFKFTATELKLICGDSQQEAYKNVPHYQAQLFITSFLQTRGYLNPTFIQDTETLTILAGEKSKLKSISVHSRSQSDEKLLRMLEHEMNRLYVRKVVTPNLLNAIEQKAKSVLRKNGAPCAKVQSSMNAIDNKLELSLSKTTQHRFGKVEKQSISGLNARALERYYPFSETDLFDESLILLTEKRMLRAQVVQGTYFLENCSEDTENFSMSQHFIEGLPRTYRFGVGASTEEGPMVRVRWSHHRYDNMASTLGANLQASFRTQSLSLSADSFLWKDKPRRSLYSEFEIKRESQLDFEEMSVKVKPHLKWSQDYWSRNWIWSLGPSFEYGTFLPDESSDTQSFSSAALEGGIKWSTHSYELFDFHPQEGDTLNFNFSGRHPVLGSFNPLLRLEASFMKLSRLKTWGRAELIGGLRLNAATTWISDEVNLRDLPPSLKHYGGGSDDVRGFFLKTLPNKDGLGALTKLGIKGELRRTKLFHDSLEGFCFIDAAYFGDRSWSTLPRLWHSPGLGIRWLSPLGVIQSYVARSLVTRPYEDLGNFYFLGLGGTF